MLQAVGVVRRRGTFTGAIRLRVVRAGLVEPEHGRGAGRASAGDGQARPSRGSGRPWSGTRARCRPARPRADQHRRRRALTTLDSAGGRDLEGLVVGAVLLGLLRHQADVGRRAHGRRVERAVLACSASMTVSVVQRGVAGVRDDREGVVLLGAGGDSSPGPTRGSCAGIEASTITSLGTCRLVIPLSESTMQEVWAGGERCRSTALLASPSGCDSRSSSSPRPSFGADVAFSAVLLKSRRPRTRCTAWPKMMGSETFIMVALRCTEKSTPWALASAICSREEAPAGRRRRMQPPRR